MKKEYKHYFQKSTVFLYPLLDIGTDFIPYRTYISLKNKINNNDKKLICVYEKSKDTKWNTFEIKYLIGHSLLEYTIHLEDNKIAYIFNFDTPEVSKDFDIFMKSKFSELSTNAKRLITKFFGKETNEGLYVQSYIYPEKYFEKYSNFFLVDVDLLKNVGELCDKVNIYKENCTLQEI